MREGGGREDGKEGGRGRADTELKTETPHVNVGKKVSLLYLYVLVLQVSMVMVNICLSTYNHYNNINLDDCLNHLFIARKMK